MDRFLGNRLVDRLNARRRSNLVSRLKDQIEEAATEVARTRYEAILGRLMAAPPPCPVDSEYIWS